MARFVNMLLQLKRVCQNLDTRVRVLLVPLTNKVTPATVAGPNPQRDDQEQLQAALLELQTATQKFKQCVDKSTEVPNVMESAHKAGLNDSGSINDDHDVASHLKGRKSEVQQYRKKLVEASSDVIDTCNKVLEISKRMGMVASGINWSQLLDILSVAISYALIYGSPAAILDIITKLIHLGRVLRSFRGIDILLREPSIMKKVLQMLALLDKVVHYRKQQEYISSSVRAALDNVFAMVSAVFRRDDPKSKL